MTNGFEGWYFKHQKGEDVLAFIPGIAKSGAFIQVLSGSESRHFNISNLSVSKGVIKADNCIFSKRGCKIDLPGIKGSLRYKNLTPLRSDIMGPFSHLPMQCRHGVISMEHALTGSISFDGKLHDYNGGKGYIEKDSGTSFPRSYMWLQCNDFPQRCSLMVSIAHIPFCKTSFTGCICSIIYRGREYRFATYNGVHIRAYQADHICLTQGRLLLEIDIKTSGNGHALKSPVNGVMSGKVRESSNARIHIRMWCNKKPVFDLCSTYAMYEYVS